MNKIGEFYAPGKIIFVPGSLNQIGVEVERLRDKVSIQNYSFYRNSHYLGHRLRGDQKYGNHQY